MESFIPSLEAPINTIREVFRYIHRFKSQVFVLKIEDELLEKPLFSLLIKDIVLIQQMGIQIILIPGTRNSINAVLKTYGEKTETFNDIRITTDAALPLVKLGASNVANHLLSHLSENGAHGVLGNWVRAREIGVIQGRDYQNTGRVDSINIPVLNSLLEDNQIPIMSNIGWSSVGKSYNISSNELAVAVARSIKASKLFFIGSRKGIPMVENCRVPSLPVRECGVFSTLDISQGEQLIKLHGRDMDPMIADIVRLAVEACNGGVPRVHVIDGSRNGILLQEIFSTTGHGTMFHANLYTNIRQARSKDIPEILHIMQPYVDEGILLQRTSDKIAKRLENYHVYEVDGGLHGCGALLFHPDGTAELETIVVDRQYNRRGTGKKIVNYLLERAVKGGANRVFVLTTQSSDFFMNLGFRQAPIDILPPGKKDDYDKARSSKVLVIEF